MDQAVPHAEMESNPNHLKTRKVLTVLGSMCLLLPGGISWLWGNLSVYTLSYVICHLEMTSQVDMPWVVSLYYSSSMLSVIASSFVNRRFSKLSIVLFGSTLATISMFLSYVTIQRSLLLLNVTLAVMPGFSTGILLGVLVQLVAEIADNDVGALTSAVQSASVFGAMPTIQLITWYANPTNESPTLKLGSTVYFTQKDVVDKVPSIFLLLGVLTLTTQVIGLTLLQVNPSLSVFSYIHCKRARREEKLPGKECITLTEYGSGSEVERPRQDKLTSKDSPNNESSGKDYTPREMLKTGAFLALWISFVLADFPFILLVNFYKLFGQLWIHDDHFLMNLGVGLLLTSFLARIPWGLAVDKFGAKKSLMVLYISIVITVSWYYFTPRVSRWLYFVSTLIYGSFAGALYSCYLSVTAVVFGKSYLATNYGLIMSSSFVFNLIAPYIVHALLLHSGWFATFAVAGGLNIISIGLFVLFIP